jgi:PAS domain S-box-containing protein
MPADAFSKFTPLVECFDDAVVGEDLRGNVTVWNRGAERLFGWTAAEMVGKPAELLAPPDRHYEVAGLQERARRGECVGRFETVRLTKAGKCVDVALSTSAVRNDRGEVTGVLTVAHDASERRQAESRLRAHWVATLFRLVGRDGRPPQLVVRTSSDGSMTGLASARVGLPAPSTEAEAVDPVRPLGRAIADAFKSYASGNADDIVLIQAVAQGEIIQFLSRDPQSGSIGPAPLPGGSVPLAPEASGAVLIDHAEARMLIHDLRNGLNTLLITASMLTRAAASMPGLARSAEFVESAGTACTDHLNRLSELTARPQAGPLRPNRLLS